MVLSFRRIVVAYLMLSLCFSSISISLLDNCVRFVVLFGFSFQKPIKRNTATFTVMSAFNYLYRCMTIWICDDDATNAFKARLCVALYLPGASGNCPNS